MPFTAELQQHAAALRQRVFEHPFVTGIGDGTLPMATFQYYMCQDYVFLIDYCRVLALAVAKAQSLQVMGRFASLLHETLNTEMALHRQVAAQCGIAPTVLESTQASPSTRAYTQHLLTVAYSDSLTAITTAILPCMWDYSDIGQRLAAQGLPLAQPLYSQWIQTYAAPEFHTLATWLRQLLDTLTASLAPPEKAPLVRLFLDSCRYEYLFWDMAYRQETWPL